MLLQYVNQETGEDLDPTHEKLMEDQERRNMSSDQRRDHDNMNAVHGDAVKASGTWLWRWWWCDVVVIVMLLGCDFRSITDQRLTRYFAFFLLDLFSVLCRY